jgi:hypothetical protein
MTENHKLKQPATYLIGIHITLPPDTLWIDGCVETAMLSHILTGALQRRSLLAPSEAFIGTDGRVKFPAFRRQIVGIAPVTRIGLAFFTVAFELSALGLLAGAHLAWADSAEDIWRTERPLPEPMPWQQHLDDLRAWLNESNDARFLRLAKEAAPLCAQIISGLQRLKAP